MEKLTILIVDDQEFNLVYLKSLLTDYNCIEANSGAEALKLLECIAPDLILLDVIMPGINGHEMIKILKSDDRTRDIPVVFITSLDSDEDQEEGYRLGAVDYITKPFRPVIIQARIRNIVQSIKKEKLLEKMAQIDFLTEIPNRRYFNDNLTKEFRNAARYSLPLTLLMVDVDYFKRFNDFYGHSEGDKALIKIAAAIQSCLRRPTDFVARYGGEEFAVILPNTKAGGGKKIAEDIRRKVYDLKIEHKNSKLLPYLTISIGGYSSVPTNSQTEQSFIDKADMNLYRAKNQGCNCVVWS